MIQRYFGIILTNLNPCEIWFCDFGFPLQNPAFAVSCREDGGKECSRKKGIIIGIDAGGGYIDSGKEVFTYMGLIAEYQNGSCNVKVFDDGIVKTQEEARQILRNVSQILYQEEFRKYLEGKSLTAEREESEKL